MTALITSLVTGIIFALLIVGALLINRFIFGDKYVYAANDPELLIDIKQRSSDRMVIWGLVIVVNFVLFFYGILSPLWEWVDMIWPGAARTAKISIPAFILLFSIYNLIGYMTSDVELELDGFSYYDLEKDISYLFLIHTIERKGKLVAAPTGFIDGLKKWISKNYGDITLTGSPKSYPIGVVYVDGKETRYRKHVLQDFEFIKPSSWIGKYYTAFGLDIEECMENARTTEEKAGIKALRAVAEEQAELINNLYVGVERMLIRTGYESRIATIGYALSDKLEREKIVASLSKSLKNLFCPKCGQMNVTNAPICSNCNTAITKFDVKDLLGLDDTQVME